MNEADEIILLQLKWINRDTGEFVAGVITNDISRDEQISFADRLAELADMIHERAETGTGQIVQGKAIASHSVASGPVTPTSKLTIDGEYENSGE